MKKIEILKIISEYENPYPKDVFLWDSKPDLNITRGRLYEFIHLVVENTKQDIIRRINDVEEDLMEY